jgi:translocator protein
MRRSPERSHSNLALIGFGAATAVAAWMGSRHSPPNRSERWYRRLDKPSFTPPQNVFPIVWTGLYGLMAWSAWRVWQTESSENRSRALWLWAKQLAANAEWSRLFFGKQRADLSLMDSLLLESLIMRYIRTAREVDLAAAAAFSPYAAWVAFATLLNAEILRRNPRLARGKRAA